MIKKSNITQRAASDGVAACVVERDYVIAHIIGGIAALRDNDNMVFKGGTALRLCYFEDYRYSADLDFSMLDGNKSNGYESIRKALAHASEFIDTLYLTDHTPARIAYIGPLGRERILKLDITDDELVLEVESQPLIDRWNALPEDVSVPVYSLNEIAGEKLRCVMQRCQCRDLFDLAFLFNEARVNPVEAAYIFKSKAEHRGIDSQNFSTKYHQRAGEYREQWDKELSDHVPENVPHFVALERSVARVLRSTGLL